MFKSSAMLLPFQSMLVARVDADAFEVSPKVNVTDGHCLGLLGSDKFGTCQEKGMGHPYLQPSEKGHQQRNKQLREGAFHHFGGFFCIYLKLLHKQGSAIWPHSLTCTS